jgi:hypothetical protein
MFFSDWANGYVTRDDHVVKLDEDGVVTDDRTASNISYVGRKY